MLKPAPLGPLSLLDAILNETSKGLILLWKYRANLLFEVITIILFFIGLSFFATRGEATQNELAEALLGYVVWLYAFMAITHMGWGLKEEAQTGTLEQPYMSPTPPEFLIFGRTLAAFLSSTLTIASITFSLVVLLGIQIPLRLAGLPVLLITIFGLFGFGLLVGGMTLVFKQVDSFISLLQIGLMFINGALVPISAFPAWLELLARFIPSTQGIIVLRQVVLDERSLGWVWADGGLPFLILHSLLSVVLGWGVFKLCERYAKQRGTLGQY